MSLVLPSFLALSVCACFSLKAGDGCAEIESGLCVSASLEGVESLLSIHLLLARIEAFLLRISDLENTIPGYYFCISVDQAGIG